MLLACALRESAHGFLEFVLIWPAALFAGAGAIAARQSRCLRLAGILARHGATGLYLSWVPCYAASTCAARRLIFSAMLIGMILRIPFDMNPTGALPRAHSRPSPTHAHAEARQPLPRERRNPSNLPRSRSPPSSKSCWASPCAHHRHRYPMASNPSPTPASTHSCAIFHGRWRRYVVVECSTSAGRLPSGNCSWRAIVAHCSQRRFLRARWAPAGSGGARADGSGAGPLVNVM